MNAEKNGPYYAWKPNPTQLIFTPAQQKLCKCTEMELTHLKVKTFRRGLHLSVQFTMIWCILNTTRRSQRVESGLHHTEQAVNDTQWGIDSQLPEVTLVHFSSRWVCHCAEKYNREMYRFWEGVIAHSRSSASCLFLTCCRRRRLFRHGSKADVVFCH